MWDDAIRAASTPRGGRGMHTVWGAQLLLGILAVGQAATAVAGDPDAPPVVELCGWTPPGLGPESGAGAVAVDGVGYVWAAAPNGLKRWDGERVRDFGLEGEASAGAQWVEAQGDRVVAQGFDNHLLEVRGDHLAWVRDDGGERVLSRGRPFVDDRGLWVVVEGPALLHRDDAGRWQRVDLPELPADAVLDLEHDPGGGGMLVATRWSGLWRVTMDGHAEAITGKSTVWGLARFDDGRVIALVHPEAVMLYADGTQRTLTYGPEHRPLGSHHHSRYVTVVGDQAFMVQDGHLHIVHDDGTVVCMMASSGRYEVSTVGAVDSEGSLWVTSTEGPVRFGRPDTWVWSGRSGLHANPVRWVTATEDRVYVVHWDRQVSVLDPGDGAWRARSLDGVRVDPRTCADDRGRTWASGSLTPDGVRGWLRLDGPAPRLIRAAEHAAKCWEGRDGRVWLGEGDVLFEVTGPAERGPWPLPVDRPSGFLETSGGELVTSTAEQMCFAPRDGLPSGVAWACESLPEGMVGGFDPWPIEAAPGELWARGGRGLWERVGGGWQPSSLNAALHLDSVGSVAPSGRGGFWFGGSPVSGRVDRVDGAWRLVETVGSMQGLDAGEKFFVWADDGSDLWATSWCGLSRVRAAARQLELPVPRAVIAELQVGDEVYLPAPRRLSLRPSPPTVILRVASLSSKVPAAARYRLRVDGGDWSRPASESSLQLVALASGIREVQVEASLDGTRWSPPASLRIDVAWPWYRQMWFLLLMAAAALLALYAGVRAAVWVQLRLERQRARIAMDLHDELGAGLGSIRILAALVSRRGLPVDRSLELSGRIERNAEEMASSLTDIVWSLRPTSGTLEALVLHLVERGSDLFHGHDTAFRAVLPEVLPSQRLALPVSRHAQLVVTEALQNAAHHARARHVELRLERVGRRWALVIRDDGVGMEGSGPPRSGGGSGLVGMRTRARAIGARLEVTSTDAGTTVRLVLPRTRWWAVWG